MSAALLAFDIIITLAIVLLVLREYGNLRRSYLVTIPVVTAWFFSYSIMLILPLDVSATWYLNCARNFYCSQVQSRNETVDWCNDIEYNVTAEEVAIMACDMDATCDCSRPESYINQNTLPTYWKVVYWSSQVLTWLLLPMLESYMSAGDFTPWRRFLSACKENIIMNAVYAVFGMSLVIYIAVKNHLNADGMKTVMIAMSNSSGLFFVMVFLGYGMVDVPRQWFRRYNWAASLKTLQFRAGALNGELHEAEEKVDDLTSKVRDLNGTIPRDDDLRPCLNMILKRCPEISTGEAYDDYVKDTDAMPTLSSLATLNKKLKKAQCIEARCRTQWQALVDQALELEEVIENASNPQRVYVNKFTPPYKGPLEEYMPMLKWYWKVWIQPLGFLGLGCAGVVMSLALLWSEVTASTFLSAFSQLVRGLGSNHQHFLLEVCTFGALCYMCLCAYRVVFNLRLFNFYYLVPKQQSDPSSLLYSGIALCRMTVPLCLNFLAISHMDNHVTKDNTIKVETAFTVVMGHLDVLSWLNNFALYYPIVLIPVCLGTLFNVQHRLLSALGIHSAFVETSGSEELVQEGKALINMEKSRRARGDLSGPERGQSRPATTSTYSDDPEQPAPRRSKGPAATRLQDYLTELKSGKKSGGGGGGAQAGGAVASKGSKSLFKWGGAKTAPSGRDAPDSNAGDTRNKGGAAASALRKMFGNAHDEDEMELLPPRSSASAAAPPPSRTSRPPANFFD